MLSIQDLNVVGGKDTTLLHDVSLTIKRGERIGLTGPSGAGKTTLIKAIMGMDGSALTILGGDIMLEKKSLLALSDKQRRALCGKTLGFIPQNPMTAFFRHAKIGAQMTETLRLHVESNKNHATLLAKQMLKQVNLNDAERIMCAYPSQLSGGMLQRVAMAMIIGIRPSYILADEPTSALDDENRDLLLELLKTCAGAGILFISHDAEAMRSLCENIHLLQNGSILESQPTEAFFQNPQCEWTRSFVDAAKRRERGAVQWKRLS